MAEKEFSYKEAIKEIEQIVEKIESENPDVDEMGEMVKNAALLIKKCKDKLHKTNEELDQILGDFDEEQ